MPIIHQLNELYRVNNNLFKDRHRLLCEITTEKSNAFPEENDFSVSQSKNFDNHVRAYQKK